VSDGATSVNVKPADAGWRRRRLGRIRQIIEADDLLHQKFVVARTAIDLGELDLRCRPSSPS